MSCRNENHMTPHQNHFFFNKWNQSNGFNKQELRIIPKLACFLKSKIVPSKCNLNHIKLHTVFKEKFIFRTLLSTLLLLKTFPTKVGTTIIDDILHLLYRSTQETLLSYETPLTLFVQRDQRGSEEKISSLRRRFRSRGFWAF